MKRVLFKTADPRPEKNTADDSIQKDALALSRKRMVFEAIEPRILLSADLHPAADALNPELAGSNGSEAAEVFSLASTETPLVLMSDAVNGASYAVNGALFNESTATIIEAGEEITLTGTLDSELVVRGKVTLSRATTTHAIILDGGTLYLDQSTVSNTTISQTENGGTATANGGSLNAVTLNTDLTAIANVFVVTGGLELNATLTLSNRLQCSGTQTITGSGQIVLQGSADLQIAGSYSTPAMVTLDTGITVRAGTASDSIIYNSNGSLINRGTIVADAGTGTFSITLASLTNEGAICAGNGKNISIATLTNAAGATVTVTGGSTLTLNNVTNAGTISATDATVNFGGSVRLEDLGIFNRVNSVVYLTGTLDNTDSTLFVDTAFNGGFGLGSGGVIKGGIVDAVANDYVMNAIGGTLNNVTLETDLIVSNSGNYPLYVTNGLVLNSTLTIGGSSSLQCSGTQTISGSGQVVFGNSANLYIYGTSSAAAVLTVDTGITLRVTGNSGSVSRYYGSLINRGAIIAEAGSYTFTITVDALTNEGVISAINGKSLTLNTLTNTAGRTVSITGGGTLTLTSGTNAGTILAEGGALTVGTMQNTGTISANSAILSINGGWPNNGVVSATDSTVNFGGSFKLEDIGTFSRTNSTVYLTGTLDNTDATLLADTAFNGGFILVSGGVIKGGIVDAVADDYVMSAAGGMLNNVTLEADLTVSSGTLYVINGLVLNATLTLTNSWLQCNSTQTISGSGEVIFGYGAKLYIVGSSSAPAILTVETGITLRVTSIYNNFSRSYGSLINRGAIIAEAGAHAFSIEVDALTNEGVISAINGKSLTLNTLSNTVGATVSVTGGGTLTLNNVTNAGTISAIDSTINVGGSVRLEDIGTFNRINSTVYLTGTLDNTGSTLFVDTAFNGGFVLASGGVIKGGIVDAVADDYVMSAIGGTLDNVTLETDLTLSSSISYPLYVTNGLVLNRTLTLGVSAQLRLTGTQTISGSGQVIFGNSANLYIYGTSSAVAVLTVDTGITLRVTGNYGSVSRYCGSLINRGAIIAEAGSYAFSIEVDALTNEGVISAINGKSLSINTLTNAADATVSVTGGSTLTLSGVVNAGTISATDATVNFGGSVRLEDIGTFNRVNSTVYLTGTLDNTDAILLADTAFNGGFILASGGVIIGGVLDATADDYVISAIGGTLNNVTLEADLTLSSGTLYVTNGLVLNATLTLANSWLQCNSTQTISGSGEVIFGHSGHLYIWGSSSATAVLTVDTGMTLRTTGNYGSIYNHNGALVNQGAMLFNAGSGTFSVSVTSLTNEGVITAGNGKNLSLNTLTNTAGATIAVTGTSTLTLTGTLDISDDSQLLIEPSGKLNLAGNMTGNVTDAALCDPQGTVTVSGGTLASPRLIEVMSQDQGAEASGFAQNFAYGALSLASNAWVKLVNESDNAAGEDPDALYVMTLTVPNGATLDLNGLTVYARTITMQGTGKVINGTVTQVVSGFEYTDLVVSSVTAPETATVGERISLEWVVTNSGDQATNTSAWYDKVVLSTDAQVGNSDDILLGTFRHDGALEPEESYTRSAAVTLPAGLDGNFQIFVVTDTTNTVYEFLREHNNTSAASPITISSSDLVVTTVSVPEAAQFGSMVDVSWTVANTGSASTAGSWVDRVYLSSDDTLNGATLLYSRTQTDALSAGADYTATASVQLPLNASMTAGSYFLIVRTNATGTQSEISTTNNTGISSAISVSLPALPDLQVQNLAVTPESGIQAGSEVTVSWDDANTGDADISTVWHDHIQVVNTTTGTTLVSQTLQHDPVTAGALAAGESLSRSFTFTLPEGATGAGDIRVVVTADSNGQIFEYNLSGTAETNNTAEIRFASTPVTAANHAPVANDDVASGIAGSAITGNVLDNDTDADDDVLTAELISGAASGTVELLPDGSFTYSPDTGFVGEDSFTYRAFDGEAYSGDATVMITVTAVNHAPVANDDTVSGNKDSVITGNVLANDTDADDDTLTAELISNASFGAVTLHSDGSFTYTPNSGFDGEDYFIYRAFDGKSYSMAATVWITVTAVNHAPVANDDVASGIAGSAITGNVLDNDTDADDDVLTAELISGAASGTVELLPDGSFTYTPDTGFVGEDSFTYRAFDGEAYSADATVMITVTAVNHAPVAVNDQAVGDAGSVITGNVLTNDTDADDDTLTAELISGAASGAVELLPNGSFTYSPNTGFVGEDSFTYRAFDGEAYSADATVTITVAADPFQVTEVTHTASSVHLQFSHALDRSVLNLFATESQALGAADLVLTDSDSKAVSGSLVVDADGLGLTFIKTGGILAADTYTLSLYGVTDAQGRVLENTQTFTFTVETPDRVLSIGDFVRGPGQVVNVPATGEYLPVVLSQADGIDEIRFTFDYDPALLSVTDVLKGSDLGDDVALTVNIDAVNGRVDVTLTGTLSGTKVELIRLAADVPATAAYGASQILRLTDIRTNAQDTLVADEGLHVAAYYGDLNGDGRITTEDAQLVTRVAVGRDTGFAVSLLTDPKLLGDINGDGKLTAQDARAIDQEAYWYTTGTEKYNRPEIPEIPDLQMFAAPAWNQAFATSLGQSDDAVISVDLPAGDAGASQLTSLSEKLLDTLATF